MTDYRFFDRPKPTTLKELADECSLEIYRGKEKSIITDVAPLTTADVNECSFFNNSKYTHELQNSNASLVITTKKLLPLIDEKMDIILSPEPRKDFNAIINKLYPDNTEHKINTLQETSIHPTAKLADNVVISPHAIIGKNVEIGSGTQIDSFAIVGDHCKIGKNCILHSNTVISHSLIGNNVLIYPHAGIGKRGFGFVVFREGYSHVQQLGRVIIQDNVEIGAGTQIDRGSLSDTIIGEGSKIDNLVHIGHNVILGKHCIIFAHAVFGGGSTLEDWVSVGANAAVGDAKTIGKGSIIVPLSGVTKNIPPNKVIAGMPGISIDDWKKQASTVRRLVKNKQCNKL